MNTNETDGATARPWRIHTNIGRKGELGIVADKAPCIIAIMGNAKEWPDFAKANAALIVQAVNERAALLAVAEAAGKYLYAGDGVDKLGDKLHEALANLAAIRKGTP